MATLVFKDHKSPISSRPELSKVSTMLDGLSAKQQPATLSWAPDGKDNVQVWSILHDERDDFLRTVAEVPASDLYRAETPQASSQRPQRWVMKASDDQTSLTASLSWRDWVISKWEDFFELVKVSLLS